MSVSSSRSSFILFLLVVCVFTLNVSAATKRKHPKPAKQEQPAPTPAIVETPPPAELTLEQKPAVPPTVTYQNRQLTIAAENSTLGDILRAVKAQTGASIELPANTNARIVSHIGPGPSRDVLAQLLNGTLFNYVLLGTVNDPAAVGKIILIPKPMGAGTESAANVQPNIMQQQQQNYPNVNMPAQGGDEPDPDVETSTTTEEDNSANVPEPEQPAAAPPNGQQPNLRTPEQLLQELQRQQQLQQQMQQQQGNPQPNQQGPDPNQQQ